MHAFSAPVPLAGKYASRQRPAVCILLFSVLMSGYQRVASAFNRYWEDGLDFMGGADGEAIDRLLDEYFPDDVEGGGPGLPGSKHC